MQIFLLIQNYQHNVVKQNYVYKYIEKTATNNQIKEPIDNVYRQNNTNIQ